MLDGRLGKCKECTKSDVIKNRLKRLDYYRAYDIKRGSRQIQRKKDHPEKYHAHYLLRLATKYGRIEKQPCEKCGSNKNVDGHHADYFKPLDVNWLCRACHMALHTFLREEHEQEF